MRENKTIDFMPNLAGGQSEHFITKKIGSTLYRVSVHFSNVSKESMDDKILRLAKHDAENMREAGRSADAELLAYATEAVCQ